MSTDMKVLKIVFFLLHFYLFVIHRGQRTDYLWKLVLSFHLVGLTDITQRGLAANTLTADPCSRPIEMAFK